MKRYIFIAALAAGVMSFSSCQDELDVEQHGAVSANSFYSNDAECLEGLAALYTTFNSQTSDYNNWYTGEQHFGFAISDDCYAGGGARGNDSGWEEINELRYTASNAKIANLFKIYYTTIYRANLLVSHVQGSTPTQQRIIAEAKTIRAFCYLKLTSHFGSVPLIVEEITDGKYAKPVASPSEIYAQIEQDLTEAINSGAMLEKSSVNDKMVNVTKQTAQGLLGKAYVYESTFTGANKWSDARTALEAVINSGKYALVTNDFDDQFHKAGEFSTESMFENNRVFDANNLSYIYSVQRLGWRTEMFNIAELDAAQSSGAITCSNESYGFFNPSQELYEAFVEMEGEDGWRLNETLKTYKQLVQIPLRIQEGKTVYGNAGYFCTKVPSRAEERVVVHKIAQNIVFFRYADVLLLAAEAELPANGGNQAKCDEYLNQIKSRAREDASKMRGNYTLTDVQKERRLELCFEGSRFPDLVRWGIIADAYKDKGKRIPSLHGLYDHSDNNNTLEQNVNGYNISYTETASQGFQPKFAQLPLPQGEIDVNEFVEQAELWK